RLKISTIFFAFLAAFSPRTMNSRYVNSFFTSSIGLQSLRKMKLHDLKGKRAGQEDTCIAS
ncbi:hypothetical protein L0Y46_01500, partial [bacterium]|nr:hypothetical protein [bacterium]